MLYCKSATQQFEGKNVAFGGRDVEESRVGVLRLEPDINNQPHRADAYRPLKLVSQATTYAEEACA